MHAFSLVLVFLFKFQVNHISGKYMQLYLAELHLPNPTLYFEVTVDLLCENL